MNALITSRRFFGTDGIRGLVGGSVIRPDFALRLGYAAGRVLANHASAAAAPASNRPGVLIGKDTRISGYMLESALEAGFSAAGVDVWLCGPMPTPAIAYLTRALRLSAGVVISASHNPYQDNGIKFFSGDGAKLPDATESAIESQLEQEMGCVPSAQLGRARRLQDAPGRYIEFCKSTFPNDLDLMGLRLVVDAAHGAAYQVAPAVFEELGAEIVSMGVSPNGFNINDEVGALHVRAVTQCVLRHQADYGIALDGDGDRLVIIDAQGRCFEGDELLWAIVKHRLRSGPVAGVAGTLMTNYALERLLRERGIAFERAAVGDRYVLEMLRANKWCYGGENSGHLLCLDRHTTGDGIIAALQVLAALRREAITLAQWIDDLHLMPQALVSLTVDQPIRWVDDPRLKIKVSALEQELGNAGRVLIRASGTEPKLRIMVEAENESFARSKAHELSEWVKNAAQAPG